jgi:hypothetical protein
MKTLSGVEITDDSLVDGFSARQLFSSPDSQSLTFDDLIALPGAIDFGVHEVELETKG